MEPAAASQPHWLEIWYWISQIALTVVATGTAIFGGIQLWFIRENHKHTLEQARATFLFELDSRWDSQMMIEARKEFGDLYRSVSKSVADAHPHLDEQKRKEKATEEYSRILFDALRNDIDKYLIYMRMCSFFETAGMMVKKGYIAQDSIIGLFYGPLVHLDHVFRVHINQRSNEQGTPTGLYEHALYISDLAVRIAK